MVNSAALLSSIRSLLYASLLVATTSAAAQESPRLDLTVTGFSELSGDLVIAVFDSKDNFDNRENPVAQARLPVIGESLNWSTELPAPGTYAVIVYQDLNRNGEIDMTRIGIPIEPYGFSNNARSAFGPPGYRKARISIENDTLTHQIVLR